MASRSVITDEVRQRVREMHAAGKGRNEIALALGVAAGTVTTIAKQLGIAFDHSATAAATHAKKIDNQSRRVEITTRLYDRASEWLEMVDKPFLVFAFGGKDNDYNEHRLDRPPTGDIRNLMVSAGIALQRAVELERVDAASGTDDAKSMLGAIFNSLKAAAE